VPANRTAGALLLLGLATAACQDLPTAQQSQDDRAALNRGGAAAPPADAGNASKAGYTCLISKRTPSGPQQYHYMRVRGIQLPQSVEAKGGQKTLLQLTFQSPGEPVFARVNCRIPATQAAVDVMLGIFVRQAPQAALSPAKAPSALRSADASLFVDPKRRGRLLVAGDNLVPSGGPLMDTGCVTAGSCTLPGVTAYGYPSPTYPDPWGYACSWGCGWNASAADYGGNDYYDPGTPPEDDAPKPCNTGDPAVDNAAMAAEMKALWAASNYSPSTPQDQRKEQYAWVVYQNGVYSFPSMGIPPTACGYEGETSATPPPGAIGFIHTHPWYIPEVQTSCGTGSGVYLGLPSEDDIAASKALGLPGWIIDASKVTKFDGKNGPAPVNTIEFQVDRCGY
jgi:hypothetical protein